MNSKEQMDRNLYNAVVHLVEAAKFMSDVDKAFAGNILHLAERLANVIDAPVEKIEATKMADILSEILNAER